MHVREKGIAQGKSPLPGSVLRGVATTCSPLEACTATSSSLCLILSYPVVNLILNPGGSVTAPLEVDFCTLRVDFCTPTGVFCMSKTAPCSFRQCYYCTPGSPRTTTRPLSAGSVVGARPDAQDKAALQKAGTGCAGSEEVAPVAKAPHRCGRPLLSLTSRTGPPAQAVSHLGQSLTGALQTARCRSKPRHFLYLLRRRAASKRVRSQGAWEFDVESPYFHYPTFSRECQIKEGTYVRIGVSC